MFFVIFQSLSPAGAPSKTGVVLSPASAAATGATAAVIPAPKLRPVSDIKFEDLQHVAVLGSGTFGRVSLVRHLPVRPWTAVRLCACVTSCFLCSVYIWHDVYECACYCVFMADKSPVCLEDNAKSTSRCVQAASKRNEREARVDDG